jgi:hypothetical protein
MSTEQLHAHLANAAYMKPEQADNYARQFGYQLAYADKDRHVYENPATKHAVLSFRGTKVKDARDLLTDAAIFFGKEEKTPRFIESERKAVELLQSKKYDKITTTGHSLGGTISSHIAREYGLESHAFNPAFTLPHIAKSLKDKLTFRKKNKNLNIYTNYRDPISMGVAFSHGQVHVRKQKEANPHSLKNFL